MLAMHETPTMWGMGRVDVRSLNPASGETVSRLCHMINNCTNPNIFPGNIRGKMQNSI